MATEEIQYLEDELQGIYSEIRRGIDQLSSMQGSADVKLEKYSQLAARISRARSAYQSFKVELRELRDEDKKTWTPVRRALVTHPPL
jgi:chromosome segregation ATPase